LASNRKSVPAVKPEAGKSETDMAALLAKQVAEQAKRDSDAAATTPEALQAAAVAAAAAAAAELARVEATKQATARLMAAESGNYQTPMSEFTITRNNPDRSQIVYRLRTLYVLNPTDPKLPPTVMAQLIESLPIPAEDVPTGAPVRFNIVGPDGQPVANEIFGIVENPNHSLVARPYSVAPASKPAGASKPRATGASNGTGTVSRLTWPDDMFQPASPTDNIIATLRGHTERDGGADNEPTICRRPDGSLYFACTCPASANGKPCWVVNSKAKARGWALDGIVSQERAQVAEANTGK
jgi:hypothetical protein